MPLPNKDLLFVILRKTILNLKHSANSIKTAHFPYFEGKCADFILFLCNLHGKKSYSYHVNAFWASLLGISSVNSLVSVIILNGYTTTFVNFNSAMVCSFKFLVIIPYQPICFCKANHFIRNDKGNWLKNADCAIDCIAISVEK